MNHIYKVIFNKATGTFMAVAEYAKSHSTGGSCATGQVGSVCTLSFARIAALAVLVIGATLSGSAYAATFVTNTQTNNKTGDARANGEESIAIGGIAQADGSQAIAIGSNKLDNGTGRGRVGSKANGNESIAIGGDVTAQGHASIAIGSDDLYLDNDPKNPKNNEIKALIDSHPILRQIRSAQQDVKYRRTTAEGHASTAVGAMSYAQGHFSNAFGTRAHAQGDYSLAVGLTAHAKTQSSIAIGSNAQANKFATTAIGGNAKVMLGRGVALGYNSQINANDNNPNEAYTPPDTTNLAEQHKATKNGQDTDIFSIGNSSPNNNLRRRIINVGAGVDKTDAVNVAQLEAVVKWAQERKITFTGDDSNGTNITLGGTLNIEGGVAENSKLANDRNIGVVQDENGNGLRVKLAKNLSGLETVDTKTLTAKEKVKVDNGNTNAELQSGGLTFTQPNTGGAGSGKTVYGVDGLKFNNNNNTDTVAVGTTRITKQEIGFAGTDGGIDTTLPYLDTKQLKVGSVAITKDSGINAGDQEITEVKSAIADAANGQVDQSFINRLETANTDKPKYAATIKDLHGLSQVPLTFEGDIDKATRKLGETLKVKGGKTVATDLTENNIGVVANGDILNIRLAKTLSGLETVDTKTLTAKEKVKVDNGNTNAELQSGGLTFTQPNTGGAGSGKTVYGVDGLKFNNNNNTDTVAVGTTRITKQEIGFAGTDGGIDTTLPYLDTKQLKVGSVAITKDSGINAGDQEITEVKSAIADAANGQVDQSFINRLETANTDKPKYAATIKDLHGLSQVPLTFEGDIDKATRKLGETLKVKGGKTVATDLTENNIGVVANGDILNIRLAKTLSGLTEVNTGTLNASEKVKVGNGTGNSTAELLGGSLTFNQTTSTTNSKTVYGVDGVKFTDSSGNTPLAGTTYITKEKIGFAKAGGTLDESKPYLNKDKLKVGEVEITKDGINAGGKAITGLSSTLPNTTDTVPGVLHTALHGRTISDDNKTRAASIADVLNAGFNLEGNGEAVDFVSTYDTVNFINGNATTAKVTYDNKTSKVAYDVNVDGTTIHLTGTNGNKNQIGVKTTTLTTTSAKGNTPINFNVKPGDDDALVKASDIKDNLNTLAGEIRTAKGTASTALQTFSITDEHGNHFTVGNPYSSYDTSKTFETVTFAGENGITISNDKTKGKVKVGIDQTKGLTTPKLTVGNNNGKGIVIDSKDGQNTITGLSNTLANVTNDGAGHALSQGLANDTDKTRAASIGDVLNAGFNLQGNGEAKDFVSTYDTVNFANGNATTAKVTYDDTKQTSTVTYDVNVDGTTLEVTGDKKLGVKTTTLTKTSANGNATKFSAADGDALVKASDIATHLSTLAGDIQTAKGASQASSSASYVDADGNKVIYDSTDKKYYQVNDNQRSCQRQTGRPSPNPRWHIGSNECQISH